MSAYMILHCDGDLCPLVHDAGAQKIGEARRWAKRDGWGFIEGKDYCREHKYAARTAAAAAKAEQK